MKIDAKSHACLPVTANEWPNAAGINNLGPGEPLIAYRAKPKPRQVGPHQRRKVIPSSGQNRRRTNFACGSQWVILKSCSRERVNLARPFEDSLIDNHLATPPPEPTGKMKYIHSEETLEIPEGGTISLLRRPKPPPARACQSEPSIARKEQENPTHRDAPRPRTRHLDTDMQGLGAL